MARQVSRNALAAGGPIYTRSSMNSSQVPLPPSSHAKPVDSFSKASDLERERKRVFAEGVQPHFLREPPSYIDLHVAALGQLSKRLERSTKPKVGLLKVRPVPANGGRTRTSANNVRASDSFARSDTRMRRSFWNAPSPRSAR